MQAASSWTTRNAERRGGENRSRVGGGERVIDSWSFTPLPMEAMPAMAALVKRMKCSVAALRGPRLYKWRLRTHRQGGGRGPG